MDAITFFEQAKNPKNWKKTHKKSYEVYVCRPNPGTLCQNKLEGVSYVTNPNRQFIISGTKQEQYVIDVEELAKTYTFDDGTPITPSSLESKCYNTGEMPWKKLKTIPDVSTNYAMLVPLSVQNFPVQTYWGDTVYANMPGVGHGKGDFLVCTDDGFGNPYLGDIRVVNGEIFPLTYDLHAFPNMFNTSITKAETPYPNKNYVTNDAGKANKLGNCFTKEVAVQLKNKGHRIGKPSWSEGDPVKSFHIDNGTYGIIFDEEQKVVDIMAMISNNWKSIASWSYSSETSAVTAEQIHKITSGKKKFPNLYTRTHQVLLDNGSNPSAVAFGHTKVDNYKASVSENRQRAQKWINLLHSLDKHGVIKRIQHKLVSADNDMWAVRACGGNQDVYAEITLGTPLAALVEYKKLDDATELRVEQRRVNEKDDAQMKQAIKDILLFCYMGVFPS